MRVTDKNYKNYESIRGCIHQVTFPIINADALDVVCAKGVETIGKAHYEYYPLCKECSLTRCKDYEERPWYSKKFF